MPAQRRIVSTHYTTTPDIGGLELQSEGLAEAANRRRDLRAILLTGTEHEPHDSDHYRVILPEIGTRHPTSREIFHAFVSAREHQNLRPFSARIKRKLNSVLESGDTVISFNTFTLPYNIGFTAAVSELLMDRTDLTHITWCYDLGALEKECDWSRRDEWPWNLLWRPAPRTQYVACSEPIAAQLSGVISLEQSRIPVVPAGIDPFRALRVTKSAERVARNGRLIERYPLVFVPAKMSERKRISRALDTIQALRTPFPQCHLVVAGSRSPHDERTADYLEAAKRLICKMALEDHVTILADLAEYSGNVPFADTQSFVALSDCILTSSGRETFLIPILEANLHNKPIIAPAREEVVSWATGLAHFFPTDADGDAIAEVILSAISKEKSAAARIRTNFSWDAILSQFILPLMDEQS